MTGTWTMSLTKVSFETFHLIWEIKRNILKVFKKYGIFNPFLTAEINVYNKVMKPDISVFYYFRSIIFLNVCWVKVIRYWVIIFLSALQVWTQIYNKLLKKEGKILEASEIVCDIFIKCEQNSKQSSQLSVRDSKDSLISTLISTSKKQIMNIVVWTELTVEEDDSDYIHNKCFKS